MLRKITGRQKHRQLRKPLRPIRKRQLRTPGDLFPGGKGVREIDLDLEDEEEEFPAATSSHSQSGESKPEKTTRKRKHDPLADQIRRLRTFLRKGGADKEGMKAPLLRSCHNLVGTLISAGGAALLHESLYPCAKARIPQIALQALKRVRHPEDGRALESLLRQMGQSVSGIDELSKRGSRLKGLFTSDCGLFLPFARPQAPDRATLIRLYAEVTEGMQREMLERLDLSQRILQTILRRMAGDTKARAPLLVGPPGAGKSHLLSRLAQTLTEAGCPTEAHFVSLATGHGPAQGEQMEMRLLGSDAHYSNGEAGAIYKSASKADTRLVLIILDEADKCDHWQLLLQLLDPSMPLTDRFVGSFIPHDMRWKVVFALSANDDRPLREGEKSPLWSRIESMEVPDYSREQKRDILIRQSLEDLPPALRPSGETAEEVADRVLNFGEDICLRKALDLMNREVTSRLIGGPGIGEPCQAPRRASLGFRV